MRKAAKARTVRCKCECRKNVKKNPAGSSLKWVFLDVSTITELSTLVFPPDRASQEPPWGCDPVWCPVLTIVWSPVSAKLERASDVQPGSKYRRYFKEPINSEMWMPHTTLTRGHTHRHAQTRFQGIHPLGLPIDFLTRCARYEIHSDSSLLPSEQKRCLCKSAMTSQ